MVRRSARRRHRALVGIVRGRGDDGRRLGGRRRGLRARGCHVGVVGGGRRVMLRLLRCGRLAIPTRARRLGRLLVVLVAAVRRLLVLPAAGNGGTGLLHRGRRHRAARRSGFSDALALTRCTGCGGSAGSVGLRALLAGSAGVAQKSGRWWCKVKEGLRLPGGPSHGAVDAMQLWDELSVCCPWGALASGAWLRAVIGE